MSNIIQSLPFYLNQPLGATDTTIQVKGLKNSRGVAITAMPSGVALIHVTIEPKSPTNQEIISFTGITDNGNGVVTLTGVTRNLNPVSPFTALTPDVPHANNSTCVISNNPQIFQDVVMTNEARTVTAVVTFGASPIVPTGVNSTDAVNKSQLDATVAGTVPSASTTVLGAVRVASDPTKTLGTATLTIASPCVVSLTSHGLLANDTIRFTTTGALPTGLVVGTTYYVLSTGLTSGTFQLSLTLGGTAVVTTGSQSGTHTLYRTTPYAVNDQDPKLPTQGENDAMVGNNTDITVGASNKYVTQTGLQKASEKYAVDASANDTYAITLSPAPTSYTNGMVVHFKANTANTGVATLNVNSLGAKTIVKGVSTTLSDGDILAGQLVTVIYDGTNFVLQSPVATNIAQPSISPMVSSTIFETSGRFTNSVTDTGANSYGTTGLLQLTGNGTGSGGSAKVLWNISTVASTLYLGSPVFKVRATYTQAGASGTTFWGLGEPTVATSGHTYTVGHVGFKMVGTSLYATQADGTTETASSALTTLSLNDCLELSFKINGTSSVDYYWRKNGGALSSATNLTTNMPAGTSSSAQFSCSSNSSALNYTFLVSSASYER